MTRTRSWMSMLIDVCCLMALPVILISCDGGSTDNDRDSETHRSKTGQVNFSLSWPDQQTRKTHRFQSPSDNVCIDYKIDTIACNIYNASGAVVASQSWQCSERTGTMSNISTGSGMRLTIEGLTSGAVLWEGQSGTFTVSSNTVTSVGQVGMQYKGEDKEPPQVEAVTPPNTAVDTPLAGVIKAKFTEDVVSASVVKAFTVSAGGTEVKGAVEYDPSTLTATFRSLDTLAVSTQYMATLKSGIEDLAGNQMTGDHTWAFTTLHVDVPHIVDQRATQVTEGTARLTANVNPNGLETTWYFEYGPDSSYGSTTPHQDTIPGGDAVTVTADLKDLEQNTVYQFRLVATNTAGTTQGPDSTFTTDAIWANVYDVGLDWVAAVMIEPTSDGGYIVLGENKHYCGTTCSAPWVAKLDASGSIVWEKVFNTGSATAIRQTTDGGYVVVGTTSTEGAGGKDIWLFRLSATGDDEWSAAYGGDKDDTAGDIRTTPDGGFILCGNTESFEAGDQDIWILKLNSSGSIAWQKRYGGASRDVSKSIRRTQDDGYIVIGGTESLGVKKSDVWILKLDLDGKIIWHHAYGGAEYDVGNSIVSMAGGEYIALGRSESSGAGTADILLFKVDTAGNLIWQKTFGTSGMEHGSSINRTMDGGFVITGWSSEPVAPGITHSFVMKFDTNGSLDWQRSYGGAGFAFAQSGRQTSYGGFILAANVADYSGRYSTFRLFKLGQNGSAVCGLGNKYELQDHLPEIKSNTIPLTGEETTLNDRSGFRLTGDDTKAEFSSLCQ